FNGGRDRALPGHAPPGWGYRHDPAYAGRRHRCGLRPARGPGQRPDDDASRPEAPCADRGASMSRVRRPLLVVLAFILAAPVVQSAEKTMSRSEREQAAKINAQLGMTYMRQDDLVTARQKIEK